MAESLVAAQNANEEEFALLEDEISDMGTSSSISQRHLWRASAYLDAPIDSISTNPRRQFQNLVHMWTENDESSTSFMEGKLSQSKFSNKESKRRMIQVKHAAPKSQSQRGRSNQKIAVPAASKPSGSEHVSMEPIAGEVKEVTKRPYRSQGYEFVSNQRQGPKQDLFSSRMKC